MAVVNISAKNNEKVKQAARLLSFSAYRRECGEYAVEGLRLCVDAVESGLCFLRVFATEKFVREHEAEYIRLRENAADVYIVTAEIMKKMSDTVSPQGVIGVLKIPENTAKLDPLGKYIVLVNTQDPSNLGGCARTAEALGLSGMIVCGGCDICNPKAQRASMGAFFRMNVSSFKTADEMLDTLGSLGIKTYASVPVADALPVSDITFEKGSAVLIGNEANGLDDDIVARCGSMITIPMAGRAESLNAHAAAAILCYAMML